MNEVGLIFILGFALFMAYLFWDGEKRARKQDLEKHKTKLKEIADNPKAFIKETKEKKVKLTEELYRMQSTLYDWEKTLEGKGSGEWKKTTRVDTKNKKSRVSGWVHTKYNTIFRTRKDFEIEIRGLKERIQEINREIREL